MGFEPTTQNIFEWIYKFLQPFVSVCNQLGFMIDFGCFGFQPHVFIDFGFERWCISFDQFFVLVELKSCFEPMTL
jgi:hypothetical protein